MEHPAVATRMPAITLRQQLASLIHSVHMIAMDAPIRKLLTTTLRPPWTTALAARNPIPFQEQVNFNTA